MSRLRRRHLITDLLSRGPVASQEELLAALRRSGEEVTQATISRDIRALGIVKGPGGYTLPGAGGGVGPVATGDAHLRETLRQHVLTITPAHALLVLRTAPGHASLVGAALDRHPPAQVVGTVCGDDTIFIATPDPQAARELATSLTTLMTEDLS